MSIFKILWRNEEIKFVHFTRNKSQVPSLAEIQYNIFWWFVNKSRNFSYLSTFAFDVLFACNFISLLLSRLALSVSILCSKISLILKSSHKYLLKITTIGSLYIPNTMHFFFTAWFIFIVFIVIWDITCLHVCHFLCASFWTCHEGKSLLVLFTAISSASWLTHS